MAKQCWQSEQHHCSNSDELLLQPAAEVLPLSVSVQRAVMGNTVTIKQFQPSLINGIYIHVFIIKLKLFVGHDNWFIGWFVNE